MTIDYGKMGPEVKKLWVDALRSGEYKQGHVLDRLDSNGQSYCCLGVLCKITNTPTVSDKRDCQGDLEYCFDRGMKSYTSVSEGFKSLTVKAANECIFMNDDIGKTFPEIADWIERNL